MTHTRTVLIVDDEPGLRDVLSDRFQQAGWDTIAAADGEEALTKVHAQKVDLILLDLLMPKMGGLDFLRKAKGDASFAGVAIVVLTVSASGEDIKTAMALGARDYFIKSRDSLEKILRWADTTVVAPLAQ